MNAPPSRRRLPLASHAGLSRRDFVRMLGAMKPVEQEGEAKVADDEAANHAQEAEIE